MRSFFSSMLATIMRAFAQHSRWYHYGVTLLVLGWAMWTFKQELIPALDALPVDEGQLEGPGWKGLIFEFFHGCLTRWWWWSLPVFVLSMFFPRWGRPGTVAAVGRRLPLRSLMVGCGILVFLWISWDVYRNWSGVRESFIGEEPSLVAYGLKLLLMVALVFSVPLWLQYVNRAKLMDRYLISNVLTPLSFCFLGFLAIWLIIDLSDNFPDFKENDTPFSAIVRFYVVQIPQIFVMVAPVTLLLSLLYALSKMSRSNEIISMLGSGKSMFQVLKPVFFIGLYASFLCLVFNYYWAPRAEGHKDAILQEIKDGKTDVLAREQLYRNHKFKRTWFIGSIPYNLQDLSEKMRTVEVREQDLQGNVRKVWIANSARWWPPAKEEDEEKRKEEEELLSETEEEAGEVGEIAEAEAEAAGEDVERASEEPGPVVVPQLGLKTEEELALAAAALAESGEGGEEGATKKTPRMGFWRFYKGRIITYDEEGIPTIERYDTAEANKFDVHKWPETPWKIIGATLRP